MIDPNYHSYGEVPTWNPEAVWERVAATRKQDRRRALVIKVSKIAAAVLLIVSGYAVFYAMSNENTQPTRTTESIEPLPQLDFYLTDQWDGLAYLAPVKSLTAKSPSISSPKSPKGTTGAINQAATTSPLGPGELNKYTSIHSVKPKLTIVDPLTTPTLPLSLVVSPGQIQSEKQAKTSSRSVYYFPLLREPEVEKPSLGQVLLSLVPFRKKGRRIQTHLILDEENGLMVNFVMLKDTINN